jgi:hypothetical protein
MFHNLQYFLPKTIRIRQMISIKKISLNTHSLIIFGNQTTFTIEKNDPLIVNQKTFAIDKRSNMYRLILLPYYSNLNLATNLPHQLSVSSKISYLHAHSFFREKNEILIQHECLRLSCIS